MTDRKKLTDISYIKELMAQYGVVFKKKFGQNFLVSESALERIAENADANVLEIGPGIGSLTQKLAGYAGRVTAVEIDRTLIPVLEHTLADCPNVAVIEGDAMELDLGALISERFPDGGVSVCANLPYYITTPVLTRLLTCGAHFTNITVMVQKEVAARLCAEPGTADYGAITVFIAYFGAAKRLFTVPAGSFVPAPKVDSAVVRIDLHEKPTVSCNPDMLFRVVHAAFGQRRKTLSNALLGSFGALGRERVNAAITGAGLEPSVRGERLSLAEFAAIANLLEKIN